MTALCSERAFRPPTAWSRVRDDESGAIIVFVAVALIVILGSAGLAIDLGRGYLEQARLSKAVDASALMGARSLRQGESVALAQVDAVARANGVVDGVGGVSLSTSFGTNEEGESTVHVSARKTLPTAFMQVLGHTVMDIGAEAVAAVPPVDMVLVLDQSGSLGSAGAWNDLQAAASAFVGYFDDGMDQVGLVSYQLRAADRLVLQHDFVTPIRQQIGLMQSAGDTNVGEGLRLARLQLTGSGVRARAVKVVVFFTDGRPTAFRGLFGPGSVAGGGTAGNPNLLDRMVAVYTTGNRVRGYFDDPDGLPIDGLASPDGCVNVMACWGWNENAVRARGRTEGLQEANELREEGIVIYAIGLGNPSAGNPLLTPDLDYLARIANENGVSGSGQPRGVVYFAPSANELQEAFDRVAHDLLVRLAQ